MADEKDLARHVEDEGYKTKAAPELTGTVMLGKELIFVGRTARGETIDFDAKVEWGCMPTESLLLSIAACLAIDVVAFLRKMKAEITDFTVDARAKRNPTPPQYFTEVHLDIAIKGRGIDERKMDRAIALSKDKYCSVYHTLRKDLKHTVSYTIEHEG
jgi:putative redox protein